MTEFATYPMALYPPKGDMLIVENEQEHLDALASWEEKPAEDHPAIADQSADNLSEEALEPEDGPETFDATGAPIKRAPGRPRKVIP